MRNLKKILSLALALVMVFSLMTFASARDFGDADSVDHTEAANVLNALGIVEGYEDGNFYPDRVVKRGEMAKMIAFIVNGGKDPVLNPAEVSYTDTANHWAKGYIEYCTGLGIVAGYGDGTFKPDNTVTGTEAAKMLLIAMGYNSDIRQYTGPSWALNVGVDANQKDLYTDLTYVNPSNGLDRDATAQMVYNALNAKGVQRNDSISVEDGKVTYGYNDDSQTFLYRKMGVARVEGIVIANEYATLDLNGSTSTVGLKEGTSSIIVTNYDELKPAIVSDRIFDITNTKDTADSGFLAAGNADTFNATTGKDELGKAVIIFAKPASNSKATNRATVIGAAVLDEGQNNILTTTSTYSNTDKMNTALRNAGLKDWSNLPANWYLNADQQADAICHNSGGSAWEQDMTKGYKTQFIDYDNNSTVDLVLVEKVDFGKVVAKSTSGNGSITISSNSDMTKTLDDSERVIGFDDVAKDDYVNFSYVGDKIYVTKAESQRGVLTEYSSQTNSDNTAAASLWIDGTKYDNSGAKGYSGLESPIGYSKGLDKEATFYFDAFGYIVALDGTGADMYTVITHYATGVYGAGSIYDDTYVEANLEDGTKKAIVLSDETTGANKAKIDDVDVDDTSTALLGSYEYDKDGNIIVKTDNVVTVDGDNGAGIAKLEYTSGNLLVNYTNSDTTTGNLQKTGKASGGTAYMTDNTVVFFVSSKDSGAISGSKVGKVTAYVGKNNVPSFSLTATATSSTHYSVQYIVNDKNEITAMAIIAASVNAVSNDYMYLVKIQSSQTDQKRATVVMDNQIVKDLMIQSKSGEQIKLDDAPNGYYRLYEYTVENGVYKVTKVDSSKIIPSAQIEKVNTQENTIVVGGKEYKVSDKTDVALVQSGKDERIMSIGELTVGDTVRVLFDNDNDRNALGVYVLTQKVGLKSFDLTAGTTSITSNTSTVVATAGNLNPGDATFALSTATVRLSKDIPGVAASINGTNGQVTVTTTPHTALRDEKVNVIVTIDGIENSVEVTLNIAATPVGKITLGTIGNTDANNLTLTNIKVLRDTTELTQGTTTELTANETLKIEAKVGGNADKASTISLDSTFFTVTGVEVTDTNGKVTKADPADTFATVATGAVNADAKVVFTVTVNSQSSAQTAAGTVKVATKTTKIDATGKTVAELGSAITAGTGTPIEIEGDVALATNTLAVGAEDVTFKGAVSAGAGGKVTVTTGKATFKENSTAPIEITGAGEVDATNKTLGDVTANASGAVTIKATTVAKLTNTQGTTTVTGSVGEVTVTNGTVEVTVNVGTVKNVGASKSLTVGGNVTTIEDLGGTLTVTGNVTTITDMQSGSKLELGGNCTVATAPTTGGGEIEVGTDGVLTLDSSGGALDVSSAINITAEGDDAQVIIRGNSVTVQGTRFYDGATAQGANATEGTYKYDSSHGDGASGAGFAKQP